MIAEKSNTTQLIIDRLSGSGTKVPFISSETVGRALLSLESKGIPTNKDEDYKYCNVDGILRKEFRRLEGKPLPIESVESLKLPDAITVVMVNGNYSAQLSDKVLVTGLTINSLTKMDEEGNEIISTAADIESDAFVALNTAYSGTGVYIRVAAGAEIPMPLHIISVCSAEGELAVNPRTLVILGDNSSLTLIEETRVEGNGKIFSNLLSEKFIGENAKFEGYTIQNEGKGGYSVNTTQATVQRDGNYRNTTVTLTGQLVRNNHNVSLEGENSEAHLYGLFRANGTQLVDNHTLVDHCVPNCQSNELYKGIADDKSVGVFNGKIFVRRDAQKTNAYQSSKNILMSDDASINAKPQLEIYANDVKCSHGTSTGRIDETAVFYLKSRGIGEESARKMLLSSFAGEVIEKIEVVALREKIASFFENGFAG
jgi:Fe-S cluster assembly protein SufD